MGTSKLGSILAVSYEFRLIYNFIVIFIDKIVRRWWRSAEVGLAEGLAEVGLVVVGLAEAGLAEVGLAVAAGLVAAAGLAEEGLAEMGLGGGGANS